MKQRRLEEVKALSQEEDVEIMRHAGTWARGAAGSRRTSSTWSPNRT
jgi:hypothetical protein